VNIEDQSIHVRARADSGTARISQATVRRDCHAPISGSTTRLVEDDQVEMVG
jgi:hypothetical protein